VTARLYERESRMERVVVGVDGSRVTRDALVWSAKMAATLGAGGVALEVLDRANLPLVLVPGK
jgi:nucleotide-binding universal stress UspA family protein